MSKLEQAAPRGGFARTAYGGGGSVSAFVPMFMPQTPGGDFVSLTLGETTVTAAAPAPAPAPAEDLLTQAREAAARLLAEAEDAARLQVAEAVEAARQGQVAAFTEASQTLLDDLRADWERKLEQIERESAGLVVTIARRVLHEHFAADEAAVIPLVREAIGPLSDCSRVQVVVAPVHEAAVRTAQRELTRVLHDGAQLDIVISEAEPPFGCVVRGEHSSVDARLESRLDALQHAVEQTLISDAA